MTWAPVAAAVIPAVGILAWLVAIVRARPGVGETALAVDGEGQPRRPRLECPRTGGGLPGVRRTGGPGDDRRAVAHRTDAAETDRFVRRQRADALRTIRMAPAGLFKPRLAPTTGHRHRDRRRCCSCRSSSIPNPQDLVIAQQRQVADAADRQADRLDELAEELDSKGADSQDPRTRLAEELRELARQLRDKPTDLDVNLARLGAMEADVRAQTDPANEQRAASLTSLSRSLSRAATGKPDANKDGDPEEAQQDLDDLGDKLDDMTDAEKARPRSRAGRDAGDRGPGQRRGRDRACATPPRASPRATRPAPGPPSIDSARR